VEVPLAPQGLSFEDCTIDRMFLLSNALNTHFCRTSQQDRQHSLERPRCGDLRDFRTVVSASLHIRVDLVGFRQSKDGAYFL
jgi:hypothetical protein